MSKSETYPALFYLQESKTKAKRQGYGKAMRERHDLKPSELGILQ